MPARCVAALPRHTNQPRFAPSDPRTVRWNHRAVPLDDPSAPLDDRSRSILKRRWLAEPKATLQELAAEYGVSAERIRQIEAAAFTRLRRLLPVPVAG